MGLNLEDGTHRMRKTRETRRPSMEEQKTLHEESGPVINKLMNREVEVRARVKSVSVASAYSIEGKSLVVLQVNCRSIYNKELEVWNLVDTYNPDVVIGTESWLKEDINNAEVFRADFTTFRRDRCLRSDGVFICIKNFVTSKELWAEKDFEMIAVEVKGMDPTYTWKIICMYRAPNEDMLAIERLTARTLDTRNLTKRSLIGGNLNLPQAIWNRDAEKSSRFQAFVNNLVWDNGCTQVASGLTRGEAMLDFYLLRPESSLISCNIVPGISNHNEVLLELEWDKNCRGPQVERTVPVYHKTDVLGLQAFLREKFELRAGNGSCVEEIWNSYKDIIFEGIKMLCTQKNSE
jgi:hypothetical protein